MVVTGLGSKLVLRDHTSTKPEEEEANQKVEMLNNVLQLQRCLVGIFLVCWFFF